MNTLIVFNHPYGGSFCGAILAAVERGLKTGGHWCDAAWYYLGMNYIARADEEMAEECFQAAAAIDPANFWFTVPAWMIFELWT